MRKTFWVLIITLAFTLPLNAGRYAGDFMMIGSGVRPLGMGGAFVSLADDGSAIYWNPSGISQIKKSEVTAMHAFLYNGLASYDHITFCQPLPSDVTIGINITRLTINDIPLFKESYLIGTNVDQRINNSAYQLTGIPDGKFKSTDDLYQFAFAKHIHYDLNMGWLFFAIPIDFCAGGNIKFINRKIMDNVGSGTGIDFGMKLKTDMAILFDWEALGTLDIGVNFQDIAGTQISWDTPSQTGHSDEVLFNTKLGLAITQPIPKIDSEVILAYDYDYVYNGCNHYGAQFSYKNLGSLRLGYYDTNFTCGATINVYGVNLDYALVTNPVGITNRIGLRVSF
jgi:hypothetical protein